MSTNIATNTNRTERLPSHSDKLQEALNLYKEAGPEAKAEASMILEEVCNKSIRPRYTNLAKTGGFDVDDVLQNTKVAALNTMRNPNCDSVCITWLHKIAWTTYSKMKKRESWYASDNGTGETGGSAVDQKTSDEPSALDQLISDERLVESREYVKRLDTATEEGRWSSTQLDTFYQRYCEGRSVEEIAESKKRAPKTIRNHLGEAKDMLKAKIGEPPFQSD